MFFLSFYCWLFSSTRIFVIISLIEILLKTCVHKQWSSACLIKELLNDWSSGGACPFHAEFPFSFGCCCLGFCSLQNSYLFLDLFPTGPAEPLSVSTGIRKTRGVQISLLLHRLSAPSWYLCFLHCRQFHRALSHSLSPVVITIIAHTQLRSYCIDPFSYHFSLNSHNNSFRQGLIVAHLTDEESEEQKGRLDAWHTVAPLCQLWTAFRLLIWEKKSPHFVKAL